VAVAVEVDISSDFLGAAALHAAPATPGAPSRWEKFRDTKAYDLLAATPLIALYAMCAMRQFPALVEKIGRTKASDLDLHYIISTLAEVGALALVIAILLFVLLREPAKARAKGLVPAIVAIAGTSFAVIVVFLPPTQMTLMVSIVSLLLIVVGVTFSTYTMMYLGRSFSIMPAARTLVTTGPYSIVRHPLYLGEGMAIIGMMLQYLSPLAIMIVAMQFLFQVQRMRNEERILASQFPEYRTYMARTSRVIPGVY
jgi:protein-S-isoprenylcysteine O-methyltransferase Ste14